MRCNTPTHYLNWTLSHLQLNHLDVIHQWRRQCPQSHRVVEFESQRKRPLFRVYWHRIAIVITPKCFIYCINFLCLNLILNSTLRGHIILVLFEVVVLLNNTTTDIVVLFEGGIIRRSGTIRRYPLKALCVSKKQNYERSPFCKFQTKITIQQYSNTN